MRSRKNARGCDLKPEQLVRNPACPIGCAAMGRSVAQNAEEALLRRPFFARTPPLGLRTNAPHSENR